MYSTMHLCFIISFYFFHDGEVSGECCCHSQSFSQAQYYQPFLCVQSSSNLWGLTFSTHPKTLFQHSVSRVSAIQKLFEYCSTSRHCQNLENSHLTFCLPTLLTARRSPEPMGATTIPLNPERQRSQQRLPRPQPQPQHTKSKFQ